MSEVMGVYFSICTEFDDFVINNIDNYIIFSAEILKKYNNWYLNSEDNCGFYFPVDDSLNCTIKEFYKLFVNNKSELIIQHDIDIKDMIII
jgi:hypothetical protein